MSKQQTTTKISPEDLQNKLQAIQNGVQGKVDDKKSTLLAVGGGALVVVIVIFFLLGKRAGRKKTTIVEIKRI